MIIFGFLFFIVLGATTVIFSVIAKVLCGIEGEACAHRRDEFPLAVAAVDLGRGVAFWRSWFVPVM